MARRKIMLTADNKLMTEERAVSRKVDELVGSILDALKDSTDRLQAIWQNTGSMGAEAQVERNVKIIHTIDASFKPDASRRPNSGIDGK